MESAIKVRGLSKKYRRYHPNRPHTLQEAMLNGLRQLWATEHFWVLQDIDFTISPGRMVGLVGHNGAGKSTLLRLIGGVGKPDTGSITAHGRVGALLDLGAGFHPDLTGRENVFVSGVIAGLTRREVTQRFDSIVAFAELEDFIDSPLRTYSSGMQMRLAFAVATHIDPDILLIDEVLAVGDLAFQQKCLDRITQFKKQGCTVLIVAHDTALLEKLCDEAILLRSGKLIAYGPADRVVGQYTADMKAGLRQRTPSSLPTVLTNAGTELRPNENRFGSLEVEVTSVRLLDEYGEAIFTMESGKPLLIEIEYYAPQPIQSPIVGVAISREDGFICYETNTTLAGLVLPTLEGRGRLALCLERLDLTGDQYYLDIGMYERNWAYAYDYHWHVYPLSVCSSPGGKGILRPPHQWQFDLSLTS